MSDEESFSEGYDESAMAALEVQEKENARLREENARLRRLVKTAYAEGCYDIKKTEITREKYEALWQKSFACAAIREGGKDD
jgi:hypothetical protein